MKRGSMTRLGAAHASLSLLIVSALLTGCSPSNQDLHSYIVEVKARKSVGIPPLPEMQTFETFIFPSSIPRDPFAEPLGASPLPFLGLQSRNPSFPFTTGFTKLVYIGVISILHNAPIAD